MQKPQPRKQQICPTCKRPIPIHHPPSAYNVGVCALPRVIKKPLRTPRSAYDVGG